MTRAISILLGCTLAVAAWAGEPAQPRVVVPGVHAYAGVAPGAGQVMTDLLLEALLTRHGLRALGPPDLRQMLKAEQQKLLLGCDDESCMAELAGALGADWLVGGSLGKLDDVYVLSLQLIDAHQAKVTARVSQTIGRLKDAPDKVGPMVDQLLGKQARRTAPAALAPAPPPLERRPMTTGEYRKRTEDFARKLLAGPHSPVFAKLRRELLEDLVVTDFPRDFDLKRTTVVSLPGNPLGMELQVQWYTAADEASALDARHRYAEYLELKDQLERLDYAWKRGFEMEKKGTGDRLRALPFEVEPATISRPGDGPDVQSYLKALPEAQQAVDAALEAIREDDRPAFVGLFAAKPHRFTKPEAAFTYLRGRIATGNQLRPCLQALLVGSEIDHHARDFAKDGLLQTCFVVHKDLYASKTFVTLVREQGHFKIHKW